MIGYMSALRAEITQIKIKSIYLYKVRAMRSALRVEIIQIITKSIYLYLI